MNTSGSSTAQHCCTGPNWGAENNWEHNSGVTGLEPRVHFPGNNNNNNNNNSSGRLDWGWDNAMLLSHHQNNHGDHHGDRKAHMTAPAVALVNSGGIRSSLIDGVLPASGFASSLVHGHMGLFSANQGLRTFVPGMEGSPAGIHLLGGLTDIVKKETVDGLSRIGLNLGGRTYFSSEDSGSGRLVKRPRGNGPGSQVPMCQAEGCKADLSSAKHYHRRHKVCELHSKAATVITGGQNQRFCQQCSRFHMLSEFDDGKRSCRKRLADHNRRRRKPQPNSNDGTRIANGESTALKDDVQDSSANNRSTGGQANSMPGSDSQALLSAISLSPPVSVMIQNNNNNSSSNNNSSNNNNSSGSNNHSSQNHHNPNHRQQLSIVSGSTQADAMYQYLQVVPQTGPQLSLSSLGGRGIAAMEDQWQQRGPAGPRKYDCIEPSVPWLRHNAGGSRTESAINLPPIMATKSSDNNSASSNGSCSQVFSPSVQNLLPIRSSRSSISGAGNWMMNSVQQATHNAEHTNGHFGNISSMNVHGSLEGQRVLSLLESPAFRDQRVRCTEGATAAGRQQQQRPAVEFLQQQTSSSETESSRSGSGQQGDVKFPDLQTLRPFASTPIYDAANTGLL